MLALVLLLSTLQPIGTHGDQPCAFTEWIADSGVDLQKHRSGTAYKFTCTDMRINADGAPNAYHPDDSGLDLLANAGGLNTTAWKNVLVADPANPSMPYRQNSGNFAGYFLSKTALHDPSKKQTDPRRYVDAAAIPYLTFPNGFYRRNGTGYLGDLGYAFNTITGASSPFIVADIGPESAPLGEVSIALAERLGGDNVNPRNGAGAPAAKMLYVVFPYSSLSHPWPLTMHEIDRAATAMLSELGGKKALLSCQH